MNTFRHCHAPEYEEDLASATRTLWKNSTVNTVYTTWHFREGGLWHMNGRRQELQCGVRLAFLYESSVEKHLPATPFLCALAFGLVSCPSCISLIYLVLRNITCVVVTGEIRPAFVLCLKGNLVACQNYFPLVSSRWSQESY